MGRIKGRKEKLGKWPKFFELPGKCRALRKNRSKEGGVSEDPWKRVIRHGRRSGRGKHVEALPLGWVRSSSAWERLMQQCSSKVASCHIGGSTVWFRGGEAGQRGEDGGESCMRGAGRLITGGNHEGWGVRSRVEKGKLVIIAPGRSVLTCWCKSSRIRLRVLVTTLSSKSQWTVDLVEVE